jgi:hypothetical protein
VVHAGRNESSDSASIYKRATLAALTVRSVSHVWRYKSVAEAFLKHDEKESKDQLVRTEVLSCVVMVRGMIC